MTKIQWTERSWNPVVGCSIVSPGCTNCYAMAQASRLLDKPGSHYEGTTKRVNGNAVWTGKVAIAPDNILHAPLHRKKPTMWFVNSMGDLFHEDVPDEWIDQVFAVMALSPHHTFQVLTKRPDRMREYLTSGRAWSHHEKCPISLQAKAIDPDGDGFFTVLGHRGWHLPNVWLGTSVENQAAADDRIDHLIKTPAAVRFLSCEPLLGEVDLSRWATIGRYFLWQFELCGYAGSSEFFDLVGYHDDADVACPKCKGIILCDEIDGLNWVIIGGESGRGSRPMNVGWARKIKQQCEQADMPVFVKQMGAVVHESMDNGDPVRIRMRDKKGGDINEFPDDLQVRDMPAVGAAR